jgi:hypothetical protein
LRAVTIEKDFEIGETFNVFLCSDIHLEAPDHDRRLLIKELDEAVASKADILIGGDVFNMLLPGDRKRFTPHQNKYVDTDAVINEALDEAITIFTPYAKNIKVILCGNHDDAVIKYHGVDIVQLLIHELNKKDGVNIEYLGYSGYIRYKYRYAKGKRNYVYDIKASHGSGGGAVVTKGTIGLTRDFTANIADCYWSGHTHTKVILPDDVCSYLNQAGNIKHKSRKGIITGAYVKPCQEESTMRGDRPRSYNVQYGDRMRSYQSTGGVMMSHIMTDDGIEVKLTV